jgi:hypothetical protein
MQITFTIKDKVIKSAIGESLDCSVYDHYDSATLKMAKMPKISAKANEIFANEKFQAALTKRLAEAAENMIEDCIYDELMYEIEMPGVAEMIKECDRVCQQAQEQEQINREAEEVKRMVKTLERAGFKIVKA